MDRDPMAISDPGNLMAFTANPLEDCITYARVESKTMAFE
jgi:hypothetical protein